MVADVRGQVIELVGVFDARILNVGNAALTISLEGHPSKLDDFEALMRSYGIIAVQRTGRVALPKLPAGGPLEPSRAGERGTPVTSVEAVSDTVG